MLPVDTNWFDENPDLYLNRPEFIRFQEVAGVNFMDLKSSDTEVLQRAQEKICAQSVILHEIRKEHAGYGMPFITYTQDLNFSNTLSEHQEELDEIIMAGDLCDSLRRRHMALSHSLLPMQIKTLAKRFNKPLTIANLGSGVGLDCINALQHINGYDVHIDNYDINTTALDLGCRISSHLIEKGSIPLNSIHYHNKSLTKFSEPIQLAIMVGIICGIDDRLAGILLKKVFGQLESKGRLLVTSSNERMKCGSPLGSFIIQHIGTHTDPHQSWGLNFRSHETMEKLLTVCGFKIVAICDDWNYPGIEELDDDILYGIDTLPSQIMGHPHSGLPRALPPENIRKRREGYNWIAIAEKP